MKYKGIELRQGLVSDDKEDTIILICAKDDIRGYAEDHEIKLLRSLAKYPDIIESAAVSFEPHQLAYYLKDLANDFHTYYNVNQFLVEDDLIRNARLSLIDATRQVIRNGLLQLGVSSPEEM